MGHERIGALKKNAKWQEVVDLLASFSGPAADSGSGVDISEVADAVISKVQKRFQGLHRDPGVQASFQFLIALSLAARTNNPSDWLRERGIEISNDPSSLELTIAAREWTYGHLGNGSREYAELVTGAVADTIAHWYRLHRHQQSDLFSEEEGATRIWQRASRGSGFSDLSHVFFSKFTKRYLEYFLDREASSVVDTINSRESLQNELSNYAAEVAQITKSFAAGWYNKNVKGDLPSEEHVEGFLRKAFGKLREEFSREDD